MEIPAKKVIAASSDKVSMLKPDGEDDFFPYILRYLHVNDLFHPWMYYTIQLDQFQLYEQLLISWISTPRLRGDNLFSGYDDFGAIGDN